MGDIFLHSLWNLFPFISLSLRTWNQSVNHPIGISVRDTLLSLVYWSPFWKVWEELKCYCISFVQGPLPSSLNSVNCSPPVCYSSCDLFGLCSLFWYSFWWDFYLTKHSILTWILIFILGSRSNPVFDWSNCRNINLALIFQNEVFSCHLRSDSANLFICSLIHRLIYINNLLVSRIVLESGNMVGK